MIALLIIGLVALALFGAPIFAVMGAFAVLGAADAQPGVPIVHSFAAELARVLALATGQGAATLATLPLFTFLGYVLAESKAAERLVAAAKPLLGWIPGGLSLVTIGVCAVFTTLTGASGVTIVAVGALILPAMIKDKYSERFSLGLITGSGSIGLLFPPSLPLIVFGIVYGMSAQMATSSGGDTMKLVDFSLDRFLFAGIVPGLVLVGSFAVYSIYRAIKDKVPRTPFEPRVAATATLKALPEIILPVLMVASLATGWLQIPEMAAVAVLYTIIIEVFVYRDVKLRQLPGVAREAMKLVGAIFILIVAATALTDYFVDASIPDRLFGWVNQNIHSKWAFLLALNIGLLLVGSVMDIFSAILVVVPLIAPAAALYQIDPYHLGVIFLLNLEIGYVHPPVGLNLFISSFRFRKPMTELYWAIIPWVVLMVASLVLVTYVPALTPVRSKASAAEETEGQEGAGGAGGAGAGAVDAGVPLVKSITFPDGGVWTPARCETPEMKEDVLAKAECEAVFKMYGRCSTLGEELDRMECRDKVLAGEDPFAADGGAGGAGAAGGDAGTP